MRAAAILALALLVCACGGFSPQPIRAGDICETCKKQILDVKFAGEVITKQGAVLKFRTPECLAAYTRANPDIQVKFVTDYSTTRMIRPESAMYVRTMLDENTREMTYAAFSQVGDATKFAKDQMSTPHDWLFIQSVAAEKAKKSN
jgi:hypothetical protein